MHGTTSSLCTPRLGLRVSAPALNLPFCHACSPFLPLHFSEHRFPSPESSSSSSRAILRQQKPRSLICEKVVPRASSMASSTSAEPKPFSVLFVCLGNICRSPAAEGVFRDLVTNKGLHSQFTIDSAGTIDYHEGNPADARMRAAAKRRGVEITSTSRPIRPSDFKEFDLILAMDKQNRADILEAFNGWKKRHNLPDDASKKVKLMCSYCKKHDEEEVPDPYYGGPQGFEKVLDLLDDACESLLDSIVSEKTSS